MEDTFSLLSTTAPPSSSLMASGFRHTSTSYTSIWTEGGVTITSVVSVPTSVSNSAQTPSEKNAKVIGGVVGSIGGTIVLTALVALFLLYRRRKSSSLTNQLPDFQDGTGLDRGNKGVLDLALTSLEPLLNRNRFSAFFAGLFSRGSDRNEFHDKSPYALNPPVASYGNATGRTNPSDDPPDDFYYRGVAKNNNLDAVFRSATALDRASSTARTGSLGGMPLALFPGSPRDEDFHESDEEHPSTDYHGSSSPVSTTGDYELFPGHPHSSLPYPLSGLDLPGMNSNANSRSRFFEQIE